jgi:dTDP-4-dehydrorhamnose reductase
MFQIDFSNTKVIENFLVFHKITCCIFCIVERLTDVCEHNWNAIKETNIDLVHNVSFLCSKRDIYFIHLSTDYVFDGMTQPNYPDSIKNPLQNYGISKLISEYRVLYNYQNKTDYCIIRTPVLYSAYSKIHDNAVCLIAKNIMDLRKGKLIQEDNYSIRRPLYITDLCVFIYNCYEKHRTGIYHFYNPYNKYTKYEICKLVGSYLNINTSHILPNNTKSEGIAPRPYDTQLHDDKINILDYSFNNFNDTIIDCFNKYKHPKIKIHNKDDLFIVLDMDGTIIDTNTAHYNAYYRIFEKYNKTFLNKDEWDNIIMNDNIDNYLKNIFDEDFFKSVKREKRQFLKDETISFTKNSEIFLSYLIQNNFNFCIVTNAFEETVNIFKEKIPLLNEIKQWIFRNDYHLPKPNNECYNMAKQKYFKNERYILGIEDSMIGYNALKPMSDIIYIYNNDQIFKTNDCYLFDDFMQILQ